MRTLGRFVLVEEIGRGSMGTVYKASDPLIERAVAIKTIHTQQLDDGGSEPRRRFLREARAAGRLNHPNITTLFDVGEFEDVAYIVMELLEGRSLQDVLDTKDAVPLATVAEIVIQTAEALDFAHRHGVVHRDIKPANLVLTRHGRVKVTDFGIARVDHATRTRTGVLIGSPGYMSPEQISGHKADGRSDIFSLGVVLYEITTGRAPFETERPEDVLTLIQNIVDRPHAKASSLNPAVPPVLDEIIDRALEKRPENRFASALEMAAALRAFRRRLPAESGGPGIAKLAEASAAVAPDFDLFASVPGGKSTTMEGVSYAASPVSRTAEAPARDASASASAASAGLLEKLRQQAAAIESSVAGTTDLVSIPLMVRLDVERRMKQALDFYQELARYLAIVKPTIQREYRIDGLGAFESPRLVDAFVDSKQRRDDGRPWLDLVSLTAVALSPTRLSFDRDAGGVAATADRLNAANLRFTQDETAGGGHFEVAGEVTLHARITADREGGRIAFLCRNVADFGQTSFVFDARAVDERVFETFANYLIGLSDDFLGLPGRVGSGA